MYIGLSFLKNNQYIYTKPFNLEYSLENNKFIAELIRDIDFSMIIENNEIINFNIVKYNNKKSYIELNKNNNKDYYNDIKILGSYKIKIENNENSMYKKSIKYKLDQKYDLDIIFYVIQKNKKYSIICTPIITGNNNFIENNILSK